MTTSDDATDPGERGAPSASKAQAIAERVASLREALEREPGDPALHFGLGRALAKQGEHAEAAGSFRRATELREDYTAAWRELGRAELARGDAEAAGDAFERGLEASERSGDLQTAREIKVFLKRLDRGPLSSRGDGDRDAEGETSAGDEVPEEPVTAEALAEARALYKQGFSDFASGRLTDAIDKYERAIAAAPTLAIAWNGLSMALGQAGRLEEAVEAANQLVKLEPEDPLSHTNLSRLLMQKGEIPEAEDARAKAMQMQMRQVR